MALQIPGAGTRDIMETMAMGRVVAEITVESLEHLDFVVDLANRKLIGNPAHGGEYMFEMY